MSVEEIRKRVEFLKEQDRKKEEKLKEIQRQEELKIFNTSVDMFIENFEHCIFNLNTDDAMMGDIIWNLIKSFPRSFTVNAKRNGDIHFNHLMNGRIEKSEKFINWKRSLEDKCGYKLIIDFIGTFQFRVKVIERNESY